RGRSVKDPATGKRMRQPGRVRHDEMQAWLRDKGVRLVGGDLDEAPQAYRRLPDVLAQHAGTVRIEHVLRPVAVVMAGADVFDPFKDQRNAGGPWPVRRPTPPVHSRLPLPSFLH